VARWRTGKDGHGVKIAPALLLWQNALPDSGLSGNPITGGESYFWLLLQMILYLGIICLVVVLLLRWLLPRLNRWRLPSKGPMALIDQIPLGGGKSVCIVKSVGKYYLLGVAEGGVCLITELDAGQVEEHYPMGTAKSTALWPWGSKKR